MYNAHRGMLPGPQPTTRLQELLDQVRSEFDGQAERSVQQESQLHNQIGEMEHIRTTIYQLEQTHLSMKAKYEEEIARLRQQLEQRGGPPQSSHGGPAQPPPPSIGHGPANLFQGIMTGNQQNGPGLAPPQPDQSGHGGMPGHMQQGPPGLNAPQGPPTNPFGYGPQGGVNGAHRPATPPPNPNGQIAADFQYTYHELDQIGNQLSDLDVDKLPPHLKKISEDWHAVFHPRMQRKLDVELLHNLAHQSVVCCVRFSADGQYIATGCNRSAQIFDVESGKQVCHLQDQGAGHEGDLYIRSVCFSPDGRFLATGAEDRIIRVWDIATRTIRNQFAGHEQDIYSLDYSSDGRYIASGSGDRTIRLWNIAANAMMVQLHIEDGVTTVAISPDCRFVAAGSLDKSVRIWEAQSGTLVERTEGEHGHKDSVYSVAFSPNGQHLVSGSLDKTIRMWKLNNHAAARLDTQQHPKSGECVRTFEGHKDFVLSVALTPDGNWVMSGSKDRGVQFWDPETGAAQMMLQGHKNSVISVAPSPRDGLFATGSGDMKARIWRYTPYTGGQ